MKKSMIASGAFTVAALSIGIIMKYMHAAGTIVILTAGILAASFVFIPLLFAVRLKEKNTTGEKVLLTVGTLAWMSAILGVLFKVNHWPFATFLSYATPFILIAVYLPVYFFFGVGVAERRTDTVAHSVLIVIACGLFFTLLVTPASERIMAARSTAGVWRSEQLLKTETKLYQAGRGDTSGALARMSNLLITNCEDLKAQVLTAETGGSSLPDDYAPKGIFIPDQHSLSPGKADNYPGLDAKLNALSELVGQYNGMAGQAGLTLIPIENSVIEKNNAGTMSYRVSAFLNNIIDIQMVILQNLRKEVR